MLIYRKCLNFLGQILREFFHNRSIFKNEYSANPIFPWSYSIAAMAGQQLIIPRVLSEKRSSELKHNQLSRHNVHWAHDVYVFCCQYFFLCIYKSINLLIYIFTQKILTTKFMIIVLFLLWRYICPQRPSDVSSFCSMP